MRWNKSYYKRKVRVSKAEVICKFEGGKWTPSDVPTIRDRIFLFFPTHFLTPLKLHQKRKEKIAFVSKRLCFNFFLFLFAIQTLDLLCPLHPSGGEVILKSHFLFTFKMVFFFLKSGWRESCQGLFCLWCAVVSSHNLDLL